MRGVIRRLFFSNPDRPFMAGVLMADSGEIKFSGKIVAAAGDRVELAGSWVQHPKFGAQFEADACVVQIDESPEALARLLANHDAFKEIGPARAKKIVEAAAAIGGDGGAVEALLNQTRAVAARAGVSIDIVQAAAESWRGRREYFAALAALGEQGWTGAQSAAIVRVYGTNAASLVRENPYAMIGKVPRFGFRTVDVVAVAMGLPSSSPMRMQAGVAYCLDRAADDGNVWTTRDGLISAALDELRPDTLQGEDMTRAALEDLIQQAMVIVDTSPTGKEIVASAALARIESEVFALLLAGLGDSSVAPMRMDGARALAITPTLNDGQRSAVAGFAARRFAVVSGGAGVGKTYTMRAICEVAEEQGLRVELCAPTGKAARRLSHSTERQARTIHRLLETGFDENTGQFQFRRNASNHLDADLVVVDEVSMVDVRLMRSLLIALRPNCRLLLVGDHHQIPSVGPGAILRDLLSGRARYPNAVHVLTDIVRQAGVLARNTTSILNGLVVTQEDPAWILKRTEKGDEVGSAAMLAVHVETIVTAPEPLAIFGRALDFAWDVQVLAPMRKGPLGTNNLNVHLQRLRQRLLGNPEPEATIDGRAPKPLPGDRVIWTVNDYELDLFNGTQAIVLGKNREGSVLLFIEDGRQVTIPASKAGNVEVAYALTIHRSQGSEWPCVVLVGSTAHWIMHDRNLLYTGASRAAEMLVLFGDLSGMRHFANEQRSASRQTFGSFIVHGWRMGTGGISIPDNGSPAPLSARE